MASEGAETGVAAPRKCDQTWYHNAVTKRKLSYAGDLDDGGKSYARTELPPRSTYIWSETPEAPGSDRYVEAMRDLRSELQALSGFESRLSLLHPTDDILETGGSDRWWEDDSAWETVLKQLHSMRVRFIPLSATLDEVISVLRQAVADVGLLLWDAYVFVQGKRLSPDAQRAAPPAEELSVAVHYRFIRLKKDWNGDLSYGSNLKLTRLKFQGGCRQILLLELSYEQQDRAYRFLSSGEDGDLTAEEWTSRLARPDGVSVLFGDPEDGVLEGGGHGGGRTLNDVRAIRRALDSVCVALERSQMTLLEYFESFDRDSSGRVSIAEFATMMRNLQRTILNESELERIGAGVENVDADDVMSMTPLTQRHLYHLMRMMDRDFSRTIDVQEFLSFFKAVWSKRLLELEEKEREILSVSGLQEGAYINEYYLYALQEKIRMIKRILYKTYGRSAIEAPEVGLKPLPGPYAAVLNKMDMLPKEVKPILADAYFSEARSERAVRELFEPKTVVRKPQVPPLRRPGRPPARKAPAPWLSGVESAGGGVGSVAEEENHEETGGMELEPLDEVRMGESRSPVRFTRVDREKEEEKVGGGEAWRSSFVMSEEEEGEEEEVEEEEEKQSSERWHPATSATNDFLSTFELDPESEEDEEEEEEEPEITASTFEAAALGGQGEAADEPPFDSLTPKNPWAEEEAEEEEEEEGIEEGGSEADPVMEESAFPVEEEPVGGVEGEGEEPMAESGRREEEDEPVGSARREEEGEEEPAVESGRRDEEGEEEPVVDAARDDEQGGGVEREATSAREEAVSGRDAPPSPVIKARHKKRKVPRTLPPVRPPARLAGATPAESTVLASARLPSISPARAMGLRASITPPPRKPLTREQIRDVNERLSRKGRNELRIFKLNPNKWVSPRLILARRAPHSRARAEAKGPGGIEAAHIPFQVTVGGPDLFLIPDYVSGRVPGTYE